MKHVSGDDVRKHERERRGRRETSKESERERERGLQTESCRRSDLVRYVLVMRPIHTKHKTC